MDASEVSAAAAIGAVAVSLVNLAVSTFLLRRRENRQWRRERLPELIEQFNRAAFEAEVAVFEVDWAAIPPDRWPDTGAAEWTNVSGLVEQLEVYATPETIQAARRVLKAISAIRMEFRAAAYAQRYSHDARSYEGYWVYTAASHDFLTAARREMGLEAPPMPVGLANRVALEDGLAG